MSSFYAELVVAGHTYPLRQCEFGFAQATDPRGRVQAKVRHGLLHLTLDVPDTDLLLDWAHASHKPLSGHVTFFEPDRRTARETVRFTAGQCVSYQESFVAGDGNAGAYVCQLTLTSDGLTLAPGGSASAFVAPAARDHGVPAVAAAVALGRGLRNMAIGGAMGTADDKLKTPKRQYISAHLKPKGMPLSLAEVEARYGQQGVDLVNETQAEALRLGAKTPSGAAVESNSIRGPVLAGVRDPLTGVTHFGKNVEVLPKDLHPILADRIRAYDEQLKAGGIEAGEIDLERAGEAGTHGEVIALDKAMKAREIVTGRVIQESELDEFLLHNRSLMSKSLGEGVPPRCINCWHLTEGVRVIGND